MCKTLPKIEQQSSRSALRKHFSGELHKIYIFLENLTKFRKKALYGKVFLSDTSSLLAYNCYIKDSITGAFLQICEIKKSYFEKCGKFTGKHLFAVSF